MLLLASGGCLAPHESRPWNPLIARTFYRRGVIEEWGSGTLKMAEMASSAGLPILEMDDDGGAVTVRFRHSRFVPRPITSDASGPEERREMILALLDDAAEGLTRLEIHARLGPGVSERQDERPGGVERQGLVSTKARGPLTRWTHGGCEMGARLGGARAVERFGTSV